MSRSVKKTPWCCDRNPFAKNQANRKVRKTDVASGKAYRKVYCTWNICDWKFTDTLASAWESECRLGDRFGKQRTYQEVKNQWEKHYKRK